MADIEDDYLLIDVIAQFHVNVDKIMELVGDKCGQVHNRRISYVTLKDEDMSMAGHRYLEHILQDTASPFHMLSTLIRTRATAIKNAVNGAAWPANIVVVQNSPHSLLQVCLDFEF